MEHEYLAQLQKIAEAALAWVNIGGLIETATLEYEVRKFKTFTSGKKIQIDEETHSYSVMER